MDKSKFTHRILDWIASHGLWEIAKTVAGPLVISVGGHLLNLPWQRSAGVGLVVLGIILTIAYLISSLRKRPTETGKPAVPAIPVLSDEQISSAVTVSLGDQLPIAYLDKAPRLIGFLNLRSTLEVGLIVDSIRNMQIRNDLTVVLYNNYSLFIETPIAPKSETGALFQIDLGQPQVEALRSCETSPISLWANGKLILRHGSRFVSKDIKLPLNIVRQQPL